jgi:hypothetical protein
MPKVNQNDFAKAVGVRRGRFSQMLTDGLPIERGAIDLGVGRAWIAQNVSADHRRGAKLGRESRLLDLEASAQER